MRALARPAVLIAAALACCVLLGGQPADASTPVQSVTFTNDSGTTASGVNMYLTTDAQASVVSVIAPGCGAPPHRLYLPYAGDDTFIDFTATPTPVPTPPGGAYYNKLIVSWPDACLRWTQR